MAAEQDEHRSKRVKAGEEAESTSTLSTTGSTSRGNVLPGPTNLPYDPLSNNPFAPNSHDSRARGSRNTFDEGVDYSSSKGKGVALPIRDREERESATETNRSDNEDADMRDAVSVSENDEDDDMNASESGSQGGKDGSIHRSSPKGKGRALSTPEDSGSETLSGTSDRHNGIVQSVERDTSNSGSDHLSYEDRSEEGSEGDGAIGRYGDFHQFRPVATVDPPVQEVRVDEDGTVDVRPEDVSETDLGRD